MNLDMGEQGAIHSTTELALETRIPIRDLFLAWISASAQLWFCSSATSF
jgi:hypothetical protein